MSSGASRKLMVDEHGSQFTDGVLTGEVSIPTDKGMTFYVRHGELFAECCVGISVLVLVFLGVTR